MARTPKQERRRWLGVLGPEQAKARLKTLVAEAVAALAPFGAAAWVLMEGAKFVAERKA